MPAVTTTKRGRGWCVRFRLPKQVAEQHSLPLQCRMSTILTESAPATRVESERRRIEALLDLLVRGQADLNGASLATYLGLPDPAKRKSRQTDNPPETTTWPTLAALYSEDFKAHSLARESNCRQRLGRLDKIALAFDSKPDDITPKQWTEWLTALDTGIPSKNEYRSVIGCVYKFGITRFVCRTNPTEAVARFRRPKSHAPCYRTQGMIEAELDMRSHTKDVERAIRRYRVLDQEEQADLIEHCREVDHGFLPCVVLGLHGVSGIDIRMARRPSYSDGVFSGQRSKTGTASFNVPIAPALRPILDKHWLKIQQGEWVFPWVHTVVDTKDKFLKRWTRLIRNSDFDGLVFHALRHSFISLMLSRGISVEIVGLWVGHLDRNTTATVYNHFIKNESVSVMASLKLFEAV